MPGDTMRNYCEKKRMLVTMTVALSSVSFAMLCTGVLTDYWLHSREQMGEGSGANGTSAYRIAHSGLWRKCSAFDDTGDNIVCEAIKYFGETDDEQTDLTQTIVLSIRRATVFPLICIGLLLAGSVICFIGHCNYRHKFLTFIAGILFIFSGLFNLVGIVLYIGSVTQEVGNRKPKEMEENPRFVYSYGISFVLTITSFVLSEFTGVICIYLYISRHKSALRKVQTRALLQRSHSEADVDSARRRRHHADTGMSMTSTPATPAGVLIRPSLRRPSNEATPSTGVDSGQQQSMPSVLRKPALSISELRPLVGNHTPLMSTSAPRWCPPPPVRFVPASSVGTTPQTAFGRSLPRTLSQPISNPQQPHHVMFEQPQQQPGMLISNSSSIGYTAPEEKSDLAVTRHHRHHHHRRSKERTTEGGNTVLSPDSNSDHQPPQQNLAWSFNSRVPPTSPYPLVGATPSGITANHVTRATADYFPTPSAISQHQQQQQPSSPPPLTSPPPIRGGVPSHSQLMTTPHQFWRIPPPVMSPTEWTGTNDEFSSASVIDASQHPAAAAGPTTPPSYIRSAHDRMTRHIHKIKHKQGHPREPPMQQMSGDSRTSGASREERDFGDSSGDQAAGSFDLYYGRRNLNNEALPETFQRQELREPPPGGLSASSGAGSLTRTPRLSSSLASSNVVQQADQDIIADAAKISAQVTHHRRTTPV